MQTSLVCRQTLLAIAAMTAALSAQASDFRFQTTSKGLVVAATTPPAAAPAPSASLSTNSLDFGTVSQGTTSSAKSAALMNTGKEPITVQAPAVTGPFEASHNCATSLAAGESCVANVTFKPTSTGPAEGSLTFGSSAGSYSVALAGNATAAGIIAAGSSRTWADGTVARSCLEYRNGDGTAPHVYGGATGTGVYRIDPDGAEGGTPVDVQCDMTTDGGGWTVVQRRANGTVDFYRTWAEYAIGFGTPTEYWIGNNRLATMTAAGVELRIDMTRANQETAYALYSNFRVTAAADAYRLASATWAGGNAGDSLAPHVGAQFTTKDVSHDQVDRSNNCAMQYKGAWWYTSCHASNLNGLYLNGAHESYADGVNWRTWTGYYESLSKVEMKVR